MKKFGLILLCLAMGLSLWGCGAATETAPAQVSQETVNAERPCEILLLDTTATIKGAGAVFSQGTLRITAGGSYRLSGNLEGMILVDTGEEKQDVELVLDGVSVQNDEGAAIYIERAEDTRINVVGEKGSRLVAGIPGELKAAERDATGAALYAEDDIEIGGEAELIVEGYINNGIGGKNDVRVKDLSLKVRAANNGIRGKESVEVSGAELLIRSLNDGIKTESREKEGKGDVVLENSAVDIIAGDQGINSVRDVLIREGTLIIDSEKDGIKAGSKELPGDVNIDGGKNRIASGNDAIDAGVLRIESGGLLALSADKDIKTVVETACGYYAAELKIPEGYLVKACSESKRDGGMEKKARYEVKSAYIVLEDCGIGEIAVVLAGENEESLKEVRNFIMR